MNQSLYFYFHHLFPGGSAGKESACSAESLGWEDPLEKGMATHFSILAENSMDRRAWQAIINVVLESDTAQQISLTHSPSLQKILGQKLSHSISGRILLVSFLAFLLLHSFSLYLTLKKCEIFSSKNIAKPKDHKIFEENL